MGIRLYRIEKIEYADKCTLGMDGEKIWDLMENYSNYKEDFGFEIHLETLKGIVNLNFDNVEDEYGEELEEEDKEKIVKIVVETPDYIIENLKKDIEIEEEKGNEYILYKAF